MKTTGLVKWASAFAALTCVSACGGAAIAPSRIALNDGPANRIASVNGMLVTAAYPNLSRGPRHIRTAFAERSTSNTYEYIIDDYGTYASIFDYPKSGKQIGKIKNVGGQGCTNVLYGYGKKTFWIVAGADQITEYQVPKKALKTLTTSAGQPSSCAMDTHGNLAVGVLNNGDIVVYAHASGSGVVMKTPLMAEFFDGYDGTGNLFFDGFDQKRQFELVELPLGSRTFKTITTSNTVTFPGSVQWDGKYLDVTDQKGNVIYQYAVSGTNATLQSTISLTGAGDCAQTWIATGVVYCADARNGDGEVFEYPAGGSAIATFTGTFDLPLGTVAAKT